MQRPDLSLTYPQDLAIDGDRLHRRLAELAEIGAISGTLGASRLALTDGDRAGRDLVIGWMGELNLDVTVDGIGNVVGVMANPDGLPPVMTGSHIDTVRTGGRFDGNLGVLAGLEVIETIQAAGIVPPRPLAVAYFTNEEGARFAPDMMGSLVYVGGMPLDEALSTVGIDGAVVGDELRRIDYDGKAAVPAEPPHAFVELHIEQGPVLEVEGFTVGAVTGVQGISWKEVTVTGQSNHAGTTPISMRRDPGLVAMSAAVFARELANEIGPPLVATVGSMGLVPNLVNVVPSSATFTIDIRHTDDAVLSQAEDRFAQFVEQTAAEHDCVVNFRELARFEPVIFDEAMIERVERTAKSQGNTVKRLPSGAGHDAQMLARVCPTAMIFTPSRDGISHNPAEFTEPGDLEAGANVLLHVMLDVAYSTGFTDSAGTQNNEDGPTS